MELQESKVLKVQPELMASQDIKEKMANQAHQAQEVTYMILKFEFYLNNIYSWIFNLRQPHDQMEIT